MDQASATGRTAFEAEDDDHAHRQGSGDGLRRLRLPRPPRRPRAPEARLARARRRPPARSRRPPPAARHGRLGPAGPGQSPLSLVGRPRRRRTPTRSSISSRILRRERPPALRRRPCLRRPRRRRGDPRRRHRSRSSMSRRSAPTRIRHPTMRAPRPPARRRCSRRCPSAVVFRPSIMFGPEDQLLQPLRRAWPACCRRCR